MVRSATVLSLALFFTAAVDAAPVEVQFNTDDGITVFGDLYASIEGKSAPIILLFHQAGGDARGEYTGIAYRLLENGYNILAIDQRSGGNRFGGVNRTVAAILGFSPAAGGPLAECAPHLFLAELATPALALRPQREFSIESVQAQMKEFERFGVQTYIADPGVHGSSMLNAKRVGASTEATWQVVLDFLTTALTDD